MMSNQRRGSWKPASMSQGDSMRTVTFFKYAKKMLEQYGHEDAAFYFEQVEEHLRKGGSLPQDAHGAGKILGV